MSSPENLPAAPRPALTEKQAKRATSSAPAMALSVLVLLAIVIGFLLVMPEPKATPRVDRVDVAAAAAQVEESEGLPALAPEVPAEWTSSYARWSTADGVAYWDAGWVVSEDVFAGLRQSADANPTWIDLRVDGAAAAEPVEVDGIVWTPHEATGTSRLHWVAEVDGTTVILTTSGDEEVLRQLASAVVQETGSR